MNILKTLLGQFMIGLILFNFKGYRLMVLGLDVIFLLENDEIFEKCEGHSGNGIHDLFDMSQLQVEINEYNMHTEGSLELVWDVQETDRVAFRLDIMKYQRGTWQPTVFNIIKNDFCRVMFSPSEIWYDTLTSKVMDEDPKCINVKGTIYQLEPLDRFLSFKTTKNNDLEGRHKLVLHFEAYDELGMNRPNDICAEIKGEFIKQKD